MKFDAAVIGDLSAATEYLEAEMEKRACPAKVAMQMAIVLDEIFSNIVKYAYPDGPGPIVFEIEETEPAHTLVLTFTDEGLPYDPLCAEDPDINRDIEERVPGGLGIYLVKNMMDDMTYTYADGKNILRLFKRY